MATLEIELQPEEQAQLQQEAQSKGLSMQEWAHRRLTGANPTQTLTEMLQATGTGADPTAKSLWEIIAELDAIEIPAEDRARLPHDGSINYKHYLYGSPKVDVPEDLK